MKRAGAVLIALLALAGQAACHDSKQPPIVAATAADSADQMLIGMQYIMSTKGIERGELIADTAYVLDEETRFDLRHAHVNFSTETGAPQGTMDANRGMYNQRTQVLEGWGNVVVKLTDGKTLKSPHVVFNQVTHKISSDTTYTLSRANGDTQRGKGFDSNQTFTSFKCLGSCTGDASVLLPSGR